MSFTFSPPMGDLNPSCRVIIAMLVILAACRGRTDDASAVRQRSETSATRGADSLLADTAVIRGEHRPHAGARIDISRPETQTIPSRIVLARRAAVESVGGNDHALRLALHSSRAPGPRVGAVRYLGVDIVPPFTPAGPTQRFRLRATRTGEAIVTFRRMLGDSLVSVVEDTIQVR